MAKAFRRPVEPGEEIQYLALYDRSAERGDPFEAAVNLALKAVLVSPDFLYRIETAPRTAGLRPISSHELATRLSYFLWGSMPDSELRHLADAGRLQDDAVLAAQADRLLDHPRSRFFARTFIGQWLGTKDVGGRVAPTLNEFQHFYTPKVAADMREEPVLLFRRMLSEDRSLLEFVQCRLHLPDRALGPVLRDGQCRPGQRLSAGFRCRGTARRLAGPRGRASDELCLPEEQSGPAWRVGARDPAGDQDPHPAARHSPRLRRNSGRPRGLTPRELLNEHPRRSHLRGLPRSDRPHWIRP